MRWPAMNPAIIMLCVVGGQASNQLWEHDEKTWAVALLVTVLITALTDIFWRDKRGA